MGFEDLVLDYLKKNKILFWASVLLFAISWIITIFSNVAYLGNLIAKAFPHPTAYVGILAFKEYGKQGQAILVYNYGNATSNAISFKVGPDLKGQIGTFGYLLSNSGNFNNSKNSSLASINMEYNNAEINFSDFAPYNYTNATATQIPEENGTLYTSWVVNIQHLQPHMFTFIYLAGASSNYTVYQPINSSCDSTIKLNPYYSRVLVNVTKKSLLGIFDVYNIGNCTMKPPMPLLVTLSHNSSGLSFYFLSNKTFIPGTSQNIVILTNYSVFMRRYLEYNQINTSVIKNIA